MRRETPRAGGRVHRVGRGMLAAVPLLPWAAPALAQSEGRISADGGGFLQWVIAIGIILVVCGIAFLNAKRSHLN